MERRPRRGLISWQTKMARNHPISYCILLAILLAVPLTNAAMDYQAALLTQFIEY